MAKRGFLSYLNELIRSVHAIPDYPNKLGYLLEAKATGQLTDDSSADECADYLMAFDDLSISEQEPYKESIFKHSDMFDDIINRNIVGEEQPSHVIVYLAREDDKSLNPSYTRGV